MPRLPALGLLILLLLLGRWIAPVVETSLRLVTASDDPAATSEVLLDRAADPVGVALAIDDALDKGDADLAESFLALADQRAIAVDPARRARIEQASHGSVVGAGLDFARGAVIGDVGGAVGLAGAFAGDMIGIGDVRDLTREGWRLTNGEEPDQLVMGLAAAGLAVTAATWISAGEAMPVRGGLTLIKALRKAGRLSGAMTLSLGRTIRRSVDLDSLATASRALARLDVAAARKAVASAVRPGRLAPLAAMGRDTATLLARGGAKATEDAFALARSPAELSRAARLSERMGRATRATLKILGRGALVLGETLAFLAGWILTGAVYVCAIALASARFGRWLGGLGRRRRYLRRARATRPAAPIERAENRKDGNREDENRKDENRKDGMVDRHPAPQDPISSRTRTVG